MAQSALTVTVANPTPPTNYNAVYVGNTPPLDPAQPAVDDGTAGSLTVFGAQAAATSTGSAPGAGISNAPEGKGSEVTVAATSTNPSAIGQFISFSCLGNWTGNPNNDHASSLNAPGTSTIGSLSAGGVHGPGTTLLTVTGTNFRRDSIVSVSGVPQITNFASATSISVTNAPKNPVAGNLPVTVTTGGVTTAPTNWVFT